MQQTLWTFAMRKTPLLMTLTPDYTKECWAMKRAGIPGKWHTIVVPWRPRWMCHSRIYYTDADNYVTRFGEARLLVTCKLCLRQPLPLDGFMPDIDWPQPETRDDAQVIADWFEEHGAEAMAITWRQLAEWEPNVSRSQRHPKHDEWRNDA